MTKINFLNFLVFGIKCKWEVFKPNSDIRNYKDELKIMLIN